jgi:thioesterase domain-containing protein
LDLTPSKLIWVIQKLLKPAGEDCRVIDLRQQRQLIFLMPSAIGDFPPLAQFRAALDGSMRFELIEYPNLNELVNGGAEFNMIIDAAVVQILASCGQEGLYLAGYSFGGLVAWEVARRLLESGHRVDFVGLIDSRLVSPQKERKSAISKAIRYMRNPKQIYQDSPWWLAERFVRECPLSLLGRIDHFLSLLPGRMAFRLRLYLQIYLRSNAFFRGWTAAPLGVPVALFRSDEWSMDAPDHGWGALARRLIVLPVGGNHNSLLESKFGKSLCTRFLQAVETARAFAEQKNQGPLYTRRDPPR